MGRYACAVSLPLPDVILAELTCSLSDVIIYLDWEQLTYLSINIDLKAIPWLSKGVSSIASRQNFNWQHIK
jgi:hypothetical protein